MRKLFLASEAKHPESIENLRNGKYYVGSFKEGFEETKGWLLGSFFDKGNPLKTNQIEIAYKEHSKGDRTEPHYHQKKIEILIVLTGRARFIINGKEVILKDGDFLFVDVNNVIEGEFLTPTTIFAIHSPSLPRDKINI